MWLLTRCWKQGSTSRHCRCGSTNGSIRKTTRIRLYSKTSLGRVSDCEHSIRAYYAMFDAARAALLASNAPVKSDIGKTHRGLMNAFSEHLVKSGRIPKTL